MSEFEYVSFVGSPAVADDAAAVARGVAEAVAVSDARQADAHRFIVENGHQVLGGHELVGSPGDIGSDADTFGSDAADS